MTRIILTIIVTVFLKTYAFSQISKVQKQIEVLISTKKAIVGVAVLGLEDRDTFNIIGDVRFPLQSVFKFYIVLSVLDAVDKGKFRLDQDIFITERDVSSDVYSPIKEQYPKGNIHLPLSTIIRYTICRSDNIGADILIKLIGGTQIVDDYIHSIGVNDFSLQATSEALRQDWDAQFLNWTTPIAAIDALELAFMKPILSPTSHQFFWKCLQEIQTGKNRIKGKLPKGTIVAHKTGSSGANPEGVTAATNDMGIVTLPNGKHYAICVFVSSSLEKKEVNEGIIADISKIVWDYFNAKN